MNYYYYNLKIKKLINLIVIFMILKKIILYKENFNLKLIY